MSYTPNPFNVPLVNMPPSSITPNPLTPPNPMSPPAPASTWNPMAQPNAAPSLDPFFGAMKQQTPGSQFLNAMKPRNGAGPPVSAPLGTLPGNALAAPQLADPYQSSVDLADQNVKQKKLEHDQAMASLMNYQAYDKPLPQFQAPQREQANVGQTIGHVLGGLIAPRLAPFGQQAMNHDEQVRKEHDAVAEHQAEIQYQAAQAEAARQEHLSQMDFAKRTTYATATATDYENAVKNYTTAVYDGQRTTNAQNRTLEYAKNIESLGTYRNGVLDWHSAQLAQAAKRDANAFQLGNSKIAEQVWSANLNAYTQMTKANLSKDVALAVAGQKTRVDLMLESMRENSALGIKTMGLKYQQNVQSVRDMQRQIGLVIAAASQPGASPEVQEQAKALFEKGSGGTPGPVEALALKIQADSGGALQMPQTSLQQGLAQAYDEGKAQPLQMPPGMMGYGQQPPVQVNINGAPQAPQQPGAAAPPIQTATVPSAPVPAYPGAGPGAPGTVAGFLNRGGGPVSAAPASGAGTAAPGAMPGGAPAGGAAPSYTPQDVSASQAAIAWAKDKPNGHVAVQNVVAGFAQAHHITPQAAGQLLGVGTSASPVTPEGNRSHHAAPGAPQKPIDRSPIAGLDSSGAPQPSPFDLTGAASTQPSPFAQPARPNAPPMRNVTPQAPVARPLATPPPVNGTPPPPSPVANAATAPPHPATPAPAATQNPAQWALATAKAANAQEGFNQTPIQQQQQILTKALVAKYPGLAPAMAARIAQDAVASASGDMLTPTLHGAGQAIVNGVKGAASAVTGYAHNMGQAARDRDASQLGGGSSATPRPPQLFQP